MGYQTGSYYLSQSYPNACGPLVIGSYDTGRFAGTPLSMNMGKDQGRELLVGIIFIQILVMRCQKYSWRYVPLRRDILGFSHIRSRHAQDY